MPVRIELGEEPAYLLTPEGDQYTAHWDPVRRRVVIILAKRGNLDRYSGGVAIHPLSGNSFEIGPARREQ